MLHGGPSTTPDGVPRKSSEQPLNRACESCRLSKVRCLVNPGSSSSQCQRCAKAGRNCVFAPPVKRRQRKRTDVRVAELEREVKQLHSLLKPGTRVSPVESSDNESMGEPEEQENQAETQSSTYARSQDSNTTPAPQPGIANFHDHWPHPIGRIADKSPPRDPLQEPETDIVDRGIISRETAQELLDLYRDELVHDCPGVIVSRNWTAEQLRKEKPILFHAIMAAASHVKGSALSNKLQQEMTYLYARSLFIRSEKSLQHIQALYVTVAWFSPPNSPAHLQIYQYGNMAASMALELGLASKPRTHEQLPKRAIRSLQRISSPEELLENCRTVLALYSLTAGFAMRLRRPSILTFNSWMEESMNLLAKSPILEDRRIIAWLKLQRIADEANTAFGFDDASTSFSLSELRLQAILKIFERRMQDWKKSIPSDVMTVPLLMDYYVNMSFMWEFAMDGGRYDAPDYRNRYLTLPALDDDCVQPESLLSRSALQINATVMSISAAHSLLECFLSVPIERLQKANNTYFVRAIYALVALMRADYAVGTDAEGMGEVLDSKSLKVDYYLDTVIRMTGEAIGPQNCRIPSHWQFVLKNKLKSWHDEHQKWRKAGGHLKRKKSQPQPRTASDETADGQPGSLCPPKEESALPIHPQPVPQTTAASVEHPETYMVPNFATHNQYPSWEAPSTSAFAAHPPDASQRIATQSAFAMGDFSAAFQNGDLYLWNDMNDNFGGWIPPGGNLYSDFSFGSLGNPGM